MPTTLLSGKRTTIKDLKAHLKARKRTATTCLAVMGLSLLSGAFCFSLSESNPVSSLRSFFLGTSVVLFCLAAVSIGGGLYVWVLNRRDLSALLQSGSVSTVPILAEYHAYFSTGQNDPRAYRVHPTNEELTIAIRVHTIELLRSGWEASQLEFSSGVLIALINMMEDITNADDLHLILDVIAAVGALGCISQLDSVAKKVYGETLKADKEAKYHFLRHVVECKSAIRVRYGKAREAQSLLRASNAPDTLLRPAYPRAERTDGEDLLRASAEVAPTLENEYNSHTAKLHEPAEQTATQNAAVH